MSETDTRAGIVYTLKNAAWLVKAEREYEVLVACKGAADLLADDAARIAELEALVQGYEDLSSHDADCGCLYTTNGRFGACTCGLDDLRKRKSSLLEPTEKQS